MKKLTDIRKGRHCVYSLHIHLVFVLKYRKKILTKAILSTMKTLFQKVCSDFDAKLIEFDGENDHVHLLVHYPPKIAISKLVNSLKGSSSYRLKRLHPEINQYYWQGKLWSPSYFVSSCGGAPIEIVRQYIEQQQTPH
jgi:putative transposase